MTEIIIFKTSKGLFKGFKCNGHVEEKLGRAGYLVKNVEGYENANWILMDFGDLIVHIFDRENRLFFDLERIWRDGKQIDAEELMK